MNINKVRYGLIILAIILIIGEFIFVLDYQKLEWSNSIGPFLSVISMILLIISMIISIKYDKKKSSN